MPPSTLSLLAPAKVNLSLRVRGKTADGYHALESLVGFCDIGDHLHMESCGGPSSLEIKGAFSHALEAAPSEDNLIWRALTELEQACGRALPTRLVLEKNLPVAAGLGGGSADAAAALRGLMQLYGLDLNPVDLAELALRLGADVPVCLAKEPAWMTGIGEVLTPLSDLPAADIVLVNPRVALSTASVFANLSPVAKKLPPQEIPSGWQGLDDLCAFLGGQGNDLQASAISLVPAIEFCLSTLRSSGARYVAMSGSGASCFALCEAGQGAEVASAYGARRRQDWVQAGRLIGPSDTKVDEA